MTDAQTFARAVLGKVADYPHGSDPHGMIDQTMITKIKEILGSPVIEAAAVKSVLDDIVHGALATDTIVSVLDIVWMRLLEAPVDAA